jgi:hypothetical protein
VNAVVNMTGVVDADALSGNGAGGSVLVTSTGDINLGGTITAQGNGTGAGGSIVTKAGGVDNVEAAAVLVAAGAPGEGGHIEVSGHRVVLSGAIEAGSGGSLLIDPMNINVTTTPGHTTSAVISESFIHGKLAAGTAVSLIAQHNVLFTATGPSHTLAGGKGDLLVQADTGNIDFNAGNYEIRTGSGNITFNAPAGSIGDASHRLSVVSGAGPDMPGVTQAGDVVLNAGESTFLGNVIVKSIATGGGERTAIYQDHAGIGIAVAGAIEVEASATGNGAEASALANLFANGDITVGGPITILANAHGSGGNVKADAALIAAESHTLSGNSIRTGGASSIDFHHAVDVEAKAVSVTDGIPVKADAQARTLLAARRVEVDGPARVKATASGSNLGAVAANGLSSGNITACATLTAEDGTLDFAHGYYHRHVGANDVLFGSPVDVEAKALGGSNLIDFRGAFASAELYGVDIAVHGEATVKASAENGGAGLDIADARLVDAGSANSQAYGQYLHDFPASSIAFKLGIDVEAHANGGSIANAADGTALVALAGHDITVGGSVDVKAGAAGHGSSSRLANAVQAHARFVVGNDILRQDSANAFHELYAVPRNFASNVFLRKAFDVEASATGSDIGNGELLANASAEIRGGKGRSNSAVIDGPVTVRARTAGNNIYEAWAFANFMVAVDSGKIYLPEHVLLDAVALGNDASIVFADANAHFFSSAKDGVATLISSDGITVKSSVVGNGGNRFDGQEAFATASISAMVGHISVLPGDQQGSVLVDVDANGLDMKNILASDGVFFYSYERLGAAKVNVPITVHAWAHGTGQGSDSGEILAYAIVVGSAKSLAFAPGRPNAPAIQIEATASGRRADRIIGNAFALMGHSASLDALTVGGALVVDGKSRGSSANGSVHAVASGLVKANGAQIRAARIEATASGSNVGNDIFASANLVTHDASHGIAIGSGGLALEAKANGVHVAHDVLAHADASWSAAGLVAVNGPTKILALATGSYAGSVHAIGDVQADNLNRMAMDLYFKGAIDVEADANVGNGDAGFANAVVQVDLTAANYIRIYGSGSPASAIKALALTDPQDHAHVATTDASIDVNAGGSLYLNGNVTAQAAASGLGSFGSAKRDRAVARQHLQGASVTIAGNLRSLALAPGSWSRASATVEIDADGNPGNIHMTESQDPLARASAGHGLVASRQSHFSTSAAARGTQNSSALADIDIVHNGKVTVSLRP